MGELTNALLLDKSTTSRVVDALVRKGYVERAAHHWREAHQLHPENWTYKRQAWSLADPVQGPTDQYEGSWLGDVRKIGAENYYPPLDM